MGTGNGRTKEAGRDTEYVKLLAVNCVCLCVISVQLFSVGHVLAAAKWNYYCRVVWFCYELIPVKGSGPVISFALYSSLFASWMPLLCCSEGTLVIICSQLFCVRSKRHIDLTQHF